MKGLLLNRLLGNRKKLLIASIVFMIIMFIDSLFEYNIVGDWYTAQLLVIILVGFSQNNNLYIVNELCMPISKKQLVACNVTFATISLIVFVVIFGTVSNLMKSDFNFTLFIVQKIMLGFCCYLVFTPTSYYKRVNKEDHPEMIMAFLISIGLLCIHSLIGIDNPYNLIAFYIIITPICLMFCFKRSIVMITDNEY